jgi:hypothetical protein
VVRGEEARFVIYRRFFRNRFSGGGFEGLNSNPNRSMKTTFIALIGCALALAPLGAEETKPNPEKPKGPGGPGGPGAPGGKGDGSFFRNLDKDGDKAVSKEEAGDRWQGLGKLDEDGDGKVTMQELMAGRPGGPEGGAPKGGPGASGGPQAGRGEFFKNADKNNDGKISKDEAPGRMWERLSKLDKDNDDAVSKEEMAAMMAGRGGPGGPGGAKGPGGGPRAGGPAAMFPRYDADKDGRLSKSEVPAEMWEKMSKADENADGLISREELEGAYGRREGGPGKPVEKRPEAAEKEKASA